MRVIFMFNGRSDWNDAQRKDEEKDLASKSVHVTTRLSPELKFEQSHSLLRVTRIVREF
jgi:hypothetical protein